MPYSLELYHDFLSGHTINTVWDPLGIYWLIVFACDVTRSSRFLLLFQQIPLWLWLHRHLNNYLFHGMSVDPLARINNVRIVCLKCQWIHIRVILLLKYC